MTELAFALVAQGGLLALILVVMESRSPLANRFLAGLLVALSVSLLARALATRGIHIRLIGMLYNATFLIGPSFYFYSRALANRAFRLRPGHLLHTLPAVFSIIATQTIGLDRANVTGTLVRVVALIGLLNALSLVVYSGAALRLLDRYRRALLDHYSTIERISLGWLKVLAMIVLTSGVIIAVMNCVRLIHGLPSEANALVVVPFSLVVFYTVAIFGFRQSSVLLMGARAEPAAAAPPQPAADQAPPAVAADSEAADEADETAARAAKYERSGLDDARARRIWSRLEQLMNTEALYLDPDLQVSALAQRLEVSPQTLSEVLGRIAGSRFYDYVNRLRVERARQLLLDPAWAGRSILEIALTAGFNSKSTFNKYFKQEVGQTPTAYRQTPIAS